MQYKVIIAPEAALDLQRLGKNEPKAFVKALRFIVTKKHRLVYRIFEVEVYVDVLTAYGHYNDK